MQGGEQSALPPTPTQVYDAVMDERKAVRDVSDEELSEDPLVFLPCGHAFPMSTMDGHLALGEHYARTTSGAWVATLDPKVQLAKIHSMTFAGNKNLSATHFAYQAYAG